MLTSADIARLVAEHEGGKMTPARTELLLKTLAAVIVAGCRADSEGVCVRGFAHWTLKLDKRNGKQRIVCRMSKRFSD